MMVWFCAVKLLKFWPLVFNIEIEHLYSVSKFVIRSTLRILGFFYITQILMVE